MNTPEVLDGMLTQLLRRGLPADYAQRAVAELADHHQDLAEELRARGMTEEAAATEASRRLGEPRALVKKTVREYQRRFWCGRWPRLTFLFGPIVLVVLSWLAIVLVALCILWPLQELGFDVNPASDGIISTYESVSTRVAQVLYLLISPALALLVLSRVAKKLAMGPAWVCLSASILAVFSGLFWIGFAGDVHSHMPADQGMLMIGLPMLSWRRWTHEPWYVAQMLLPLGIGGVMLWRMKQLSQRAARLAVGDC